MSGDVWLDNEVRRGGGDLMREEPANGQARPGPNPAGGRGLGGVVRARGEEAAADGGVPRDW